MTAMCFPRDVLRLSAGVHQPLQLSKLLPMPPNGSSDTFESLNTSLRIRVASLSRESNAASPDSDVFKEAAALLNQVQPSTVVHGLVVQLSLDAQGCRLLQAALEASHSFERKQIALEFCGHVRKALESPHANHVLQRIIELVPPVVALFILDELAGTWNLATVVQHRFGCRLMERVLEHFTACPTAHGALQYFQSNGVFGDLAAHCYHVYGTHVMQHLVEYGASTHQRLVCEALCKDLPRAALDEYAVGVLDKALTFLSPAEQLALATSIVQSDGLLSRMAMCWRGQPAAERVLRILEGESLRVAVNQVGAHAPQLKKSKGGRAILFLAVKRSSSMGLPPALDDAAGDVSDGTSSSTCSHP